MLVPGVGGGGISVDSRNGGGGSVVEPPPPCFDDDDEWWGDGMGVGRPGGGEIGILTTVLGGGGGMCEGLHDGGGGGIADAGVMHDGDVEGEVRAPVVGDSSSIVLVVVVVVVVVDGVGGVGIADGGGGMELGGGIRECVLGLIPRAMATVQLGTERAVVSGGEGDWLFDSLGGGTGGVHGGEAVNRRFVAGEIISEAGDGGGGMVKGGGTDDGGGEILLLRIAFAERVSGVGGGGETLLSGLLLCSTWTMGDGGGIGVIVPSGQWEAVLVRNECMVTSISCRGS